MSTDVPMTDDKVQTPSSSTVPKRLPVTVTKPIPYTFDLGNLLCTDANPLPPTTSITESDLQSAARDCAQVLLNQLLSTCPITRSSDNSSISLTLPAPTTPLPREKHVPKDKEPTKWELFAKKKGITKRNDTSRVYDDVKGDWVRKWGRDGKNKELDQQAIVELDDKPSLGKRKRAGASAGAGDEHDDPRAASRAERKERVKRQLRKMRANETRGA